MNPFISGLVAGLPIVISFGPGFFLMFQSIANKGIKAGFAVLLGTLLADVAIMLVCLFKISILIDSVLKSSMVNIIGAIVLMGAGIASFLASIRKHENDRLGNMLSYKSLRLYFWKGFLVTAANPMNVVFWLGVIGIVGKQYGLQSNQILYFVSGLFLATILGDVLKCFLSVKLGSIINSLVYKLLNYASGVILFGIGVYFLLIAF
jgi:threonine/homoserine/homoserine lactone efflux protein